MATLRAAQLRLAGSHRSITTATLVILFASCALSSGQTLKVLHVFNGGQGDGYNPEAPVVVAPNGVVYGTTWFGGNLHCGITVGCGEVFQVVPPSGSQKRWTYSAIYEFTGGSDGCCVSSALTLDSQGRLYGVNASLFRLTPPASGKFWQYTDLYDFSGFAPSTPLLFDNAGNLYGVTPLGGPPNCGTYGCGTVSQFVPTQSGPWTQNILYQFTGGTDGAYPASIVLDDTTGEIYGVAQGGGIISPNCTYTGGCGTVFKLTPAQSGIWTFSVPYSFTGVHSGGPYILVRDSNGKLRGIAERGQYGERALQRDAVSPAVFQAAGLQHGPVVFLGGGGRDLDSAAS